MSIKRNIKVGSIHGFLSMFLVIVPVLVPYWRSLGLSIEEILIVQSIFGVSVALFEFPTGYIADIFSRKASILLGEIIGAIGFTLLPFLTNFWGLVLFEVIIALGTSLVSGADLAIIYDSLDDEDSKLREIARVNQWKLVGEAIAALTTCIFVSISFETLLIAQAVAGWLPFVAALFFIEPEIRKSVAQPHFSRVAEILSTTLRSSKAIRMIFINSVIWGLSSFSVVWLLQEHWKLSGVPVQIFGLLWCVVMLVAAISGRLVEGLERSLGMQRIIYISAIIPCVGYLCMASSLGIIGVGAATLFYVSRGFTTVAYSELFNSHIPSEMRASANSLRSLAFRLGSGVIGPLTGTSIHFFGFRSTLGILGITFTILVPLLIPNLVKGLKGSSNE